MDVSFEDRAQFECSACHRDFKASIWLLIDASARPDLILDDKLFTPVCSHCGHPAEIDYPLLLYLPGFFMAWVGTGFGTALWHALGGIVGCMIYGLGASFFIKMDGARGA